MPIKVRRGKRLSVCQRVLRGLGKEQTLCSEWLPIQINIRGTMGNNELVHLFIQTSQQFFI